MLTSISLLLVLIPGLYAWVKGKHVRSLQADDPLLAERFHAYQVAVLQMTLLCILLVSFFYRWQLALLAVLTMMAGSFPVRKDLYEETWNFPIYLYFKLRVFLASSGLIFLIGLIPFLAAKAGPWRWLEIGILAFLSFAWLVFGQEFFFRLYGAKPMSNCALKSRFEEMAANSKVDQQPLLMVADFPGGKIANAFALPSTGKPAVMFTQPLLDELSAEQSTAIFAHELAHLEHMNGRFVKRQAIRISLLIILALATAPCAELLFGSGALQGWIMLTTGMMWMAILIITLTRGRQQHETESDQRAVELCGDAEVMAQALERLHQLSRIPRRWNVETERASSHPSLANRIRALQDSDNPPQSPLQAVVLASPTAGRFVILESNRIHWLEGVPSDVEPQADLLRNAATSISSFAYSELTELLLKPSGRKAASLCAVTRKGQKKSMSVAEKDLALAQSSLNQVDGLLATSKIGHEMHRLVTMLLGLAMVMANIGWAFNWWLLPLAIFLLIWPRTFTLVAIAAALLSTELMALMQEAPQSVNDWFALSVALVLSIGTLIYVSLHADDRQISTTKTLSRLAVLLLIIASIHWFAIASALYDQDGLDLLGLYQSAFRFGGAISAMFALASLTAIFATTGKRLWPTLLFLLLGASSVFLQSPYFGTEVAHDAFAGRIQNLNSNHATLQLVREIPIDANALQLRMSADANQFAYSFHDMEDDSNHFKLISTDGNTRATQQANRLTFVDENHLLRLSTVQKKTRLELMAHRENTWQAIKQWDLPTMAGHFLAFNSKTEQWRVLGHANGNGSMLMVIGKLAEEKLSIREFPVFPTFFYTNTVINEDLLEQKNDYGKQPFWIGMHSKMYVNDGKAKRTNLVNSGRFGISCLSTLPGEQLTQIPCLSMDRAASLLTFIRLDNGSFEPVFRIPGYMNFDNGVRQGNHYYFLNSGQSIYRFNLITHRGTILELPREQGFFSFAVSEPWLAVTTTAKQGKYLIQVYKLPEDIYGESPSDKQLN